MPFVVTPVGEYENAFFYFNGQSFQPQRLGRDSGYYGVLTRKQPKETIDRIATFSAISDKLQIAGADWSFRKGDTNNPDEIEAQFGLAMEQQPVGEWDVDTEALAAMLVAAGAIPDSHLERITAGLKKGQPVELKFGLKGRWDVYHYICRLIYQLRTSRFFRSVLLLNEEDKTLVELISGFIKNERWPLPFEWPDTERVLNPSQSPYGLLLFSPPDYDALLAVRRNRDVTKYAAEVKKHLMADGDKQEVGLLEAMREAVHKKEITEHSKFIFEAESWWWRAMHFVPVLDKIAIFGEIFADLCGIWAKKKKKKKDYKWYAIGPRMQNIAIEDYLQRKDNISRAGT